MISSTMDQVSLGVKRDEDFPSVSLGNFTAKVAFLETNILILNY